MATAVAVCSLENYLALPDHTLDERIRAARMALGRDLVILGHHYQRDEVIQFADFRGDSYKLSQEAAKAGGKYIVFCGVHFMAESADILARPGQIVILPDLNAGCSMADMADISQVEDCWEQLERAGVAGADGRGITPITYINSTAAIKAFVGERGGVVCTSSNAVRSDAVGAGEELRSCSSFPTSTWGATRVTRLAFRSERNGGLGSLSDQRRSHPRPAARGENHLCGRDTARSTSASLP
jgi:quinolinate synthase